MRVKNWELIEEASESERLPVGAYVVVLTNVEDNPSKEYLEITYDIAEGPYKGHYSDNWGADNPWAHRFFRSYKDTAENMFKAFLKRLEESNFGKFSIVEWQTESNEKEFVGLELGVVLQEEEYEANDGSVKTRTNVARLYKADDIRSGNFKLLDKIVLERESSTAIPTADDDVPF